MIQQNIISSPQRAAGAYQASFRLHRVMLAILLILGATIMVSIYVYQATVIYSAQRNIQAKYALYAQNKRAEANTLAIYAKNQSMATMTHRAQAMGFGPPKSSQIKYVRVPANPAIMQTQSHIVARE